VVPYNPLSMLLLQAESESNVSKQNERRERDLERLRQVLGVCPCRCLFLLVPFQSLACVFPSQSGSTLSLSMSAFSVALTVSFFLLLLRLLHVKRSLFVHKISIPPYLLFFSLSAEGR
jgi:hypothetical protein